MICCICYTEDKICLYNGYSLCKRHLKRMVDTGSIREVQMERRKELQPKEQNA